VKQVTTSLTRTLATSEQGPPLRAIRQAILRAVIYADMFDHAPSASELYRVLDAPGVSQARFEDGLQALQEEEALLNCNGRWMLAGREELVSIWRRRQGHSARKWRAARRYTAWIRCLPFVRMVAVTGTLAVQSAEASDDIDLFLITAPGRVWLARALTIVIVRWAWLFGETLCPNYLIASNALAVAERNLYSARELAQMQPLYGAAWYAELCKHNRWVLEYLPNTLANCEESSLSLDCMPALLQLCKRMGEWLLNVRLGATLDRWEMQRKVAKLLKERVPKAPAEASFSPVQCKGHFEGHATRILQRYQERVAALEAAQQE
jgi:ketosteroid isomerase-like protein